MSGLAGLFLRRPSPEAAPLLRQMSARLAHRGPDDEGYLLLPPDYSATGTIAFSGSNTLPEVRRNLQGATIDQASDRPWVGGLAHRRLAISNLGPEGHQPYVNPRGAFILDGSIYNLVDIRRQLEAEHGIVISNTSEGATLLAAYQVWQERMLNRIEGSFALAVLDTANRVLFAARDRLGVKPFYFLDVAEGMAFGSEQKALYGLPFCPMRLSKTAVFEYLVRGTNEARQTGLVKAVQELLPGHCMELNLETGNVKTWEWFKTEPNLRWEGYRESSYKRHRTRVAELLVESITPRLQTEQSLGACLSGGLDSNALVGLSAKATAAGVGSGSGLATFTVGFPGTETDESKVAQAIAQKAGLAWQGVFPTAADLARDLSGLVRAYDLPLLSPSAYARHRLMQTASESGIRVMLDGLGADELFGGYTHHFQSYMLQLWEENRYGQVFTQLLQANNSFANRSQALRMLFKQMRSLVSNRHAQEEAFRRQSGEFSLLRKSFWDIQKRRLGEEITGPEPGLNQALTRDLTGAVMRNHLRSADRSAMQFGIENRVPFADSTALIEYVQRVPAVYKIKNGQSKSLLRSAVRGLVPETIRTRRNRTSFAGPDKAWIEHLSPVLKEAIGTPGMEEFMHINQIRDHWDELMAKAQAGDPHRIFRLGALGLWMQETLHGGQP